MSEGEVAHLGWVTAQPARARRRVRAARTFISPEVASAPIYLYHRGGLELPVVIPMAILSDTIDIHLQTVGMNATSRRYQLFVRIKRELPALSNA
jgi:hypothetical protein